MAANTLARVLRQTGARSRTCFCTASEAAERIIHRAVPQDSVREITRYYFEGVNPADALGPHPGDKKVVLQVPIDDIQVSPLARERIKALCGPRYSASTRVLRLVGDELPTRDQNLAHVRQTLADIVDASEDMRSWRTKHEEAMSGGGVLLRGVRGGMPASESEAELEGEAASAGEGVNEAELDQGSDLDEGITEAESEQE